MALFATIGLLGVGLVYSAKNLYTHQDNQVSIKKSFYLNKKEVRQKLIHEIDVPRILPRLKSEEEKQAESRKKYLVVSIINFRNSSNLICKINNYLLTFFKHKLNLPLVVLIHVL